MSENDSMSDDATHQDADSNPTYPGHRERITKVRVNEMKSFYMTDEEIVSMLETFSDDQVSLVITATCQIMANRLNITIPEVFKILQETYAEHLVGQVMAMAITIEDLEDGDAG